VEQRYKFLRIVNVNGMVQHYPKTRNNRVRHENPLVFQTLSENHLGPLLGYCSEYYTVFASQPSFELAIVKMDVVKATAYKHHELWPKALRIVKEMFDIPFRFGTKILSPEEIAENIVKTTSPGHPWNLYGLKTKGDVLASPMFHDYMKVMPENWPNPPLWKVVPKLDEWYSPEDLDNNKLRSIQIPPLEFIWYQKMFYHTQNQAMKMEGWSAYGFNPYCGGTDRLAQALLDFPIFVMYDVKSWDRGLPIMEECYKLRNEYISPDWLATARWIAENTVKTYLQHPNGFVFEKDVGNNSGSGNTTNDNIICHCMILALTLLALYAGDTKKVLATIAQLFGDDNVLGLYKTGHTFREIQACFEFIFGLFDMRFDPFLVTSNLEDCEFLGFKFKHTPGGWVPQYNLGKLTNSYLYQTGPKYSELETISRAWSLTIMVAGNGEEVYNSFADATTSLLRSVQKSSDPTVRTYVKYGVPTYSEVISFYLGSESLDMGLFALAFKLGAHQAGPVERHKEIFMKKTVVIETGKRRQRKPKGGKAQQSLPARELSVLQQQTRQIAELRKIARIESRAPRISYAPPKTSPAPAPRVRVTRDGTIRNHAPRVLPTSGTFLTQALDPMHDVPIHNKVGWPDEVVLPSVIRNGKFSIPLTKPANDTIPGKWDCHIILQPWLNRIGMSEYNRVNNVLSTAPIGEERPIGGLQAYATASGTPFAYGPNGAGDAIPEIGVLELPPEYTPGVGRIVGLGIELINETAALYVDGDIICWRAPEPHIQNELLYQADQSEPPIIYPFNPRSSQFFRYPPRDGKQALIYDGTTQWKAKDGSYMVATFNDFQNPANMVGYTGPAMIFTGDKEDNVTTYAMAETLNTTNVWTASPIHVPPVSGLQQEMNVSPAVKLHPINQMGMILTGLAPETTLQLKLNVYYESFPSIAQFDILNLARPSCPYDPVALAYLSKVTAQMPVAVMSAHNASGSWWREILRMLSAVAPAVGTAFGQPMLGAAASVGLSSLSRVGS